MLQLYSDSTGQKKKKEKKILLDKIMIPLVIAKPVLPKLQIAIK